MKREYFTPLNVALFLCPIVFALIVIFKDYWLHYNWSIFQNALMYDIAVALIWCYLAVILTAAFAAIAVIYMSRFSATQKVSAKIYLMGFWVAGFIIVIFPE